MEKKVEMNLTEITKIPQQPQLGIDFSKFDFEKAKRVTRIENLPIYVISTQSESTVMYAVKQDNAFVSFLIGVHGTLDGPCLYVMRTYTIPSERNKGLVTILYKALVDQLDITLVSDVDLSPESISVWKKLREMLPVQVLFPTTKELVDVKEVNDQQLYDPTLKCRFVIRHTPNVVTEKFNMPCNYNSSFWEDNINYTHPENDGKYI